MTKPAQKLIFSIFFYLTFFFLFFLLPQKIEAACSDKYKTISYEYAECEISSKTGKYYCSYNDVSYKHYCQLKWNPGLRIYECMAVNAIVSCDCSITKIGNKCSTSCDEADISCGSVSKPTSTPTPTPTPTPKPEEKDCTWTGWKATGECCDRAGKEREKRYCKDSSGNIIRTDSRCTLRNDDCKDKETVPIPTPTSPPPVTECTPGTWSAERCTSCNAQGVWNQNCQDYGNPNYPNFSQAAYCDCLKKCDYPAYLRNPSCVSQGVSCQSKGGFCSYKDQCPTSKGYKNIGATPDCPEGCCSC